jgi:hypothetical protein
MQKAIRRGMSRAAQVIVLGDRARWIWGIAEEHFYGAIQIVDFYHAREHVALIADLVYGTGTIKSKEWMSARREQLDAGDVEAVIACMSRLRPSHAKVQEEVRIAADYFHRNAQRMRYAEFRKQGLFVGSGVMEAGCKTICGQRLKRSGMHWKRCQCHYRPTLLQTQLTLGRILGGSCTRLVLFTHKFVVHPLDSNHAHRLAFRQEWWCLVVYTL